MGESTLKCVGWADVRKPNNRATSAMLGFVPQPNLQPQLRFLGLILRVRVQPTARSFLRAALQRCELVAKWL